MQREINLADPIAGVVQVIRYVADAEIPGLEIEGLFPLSDQLLLNASLGLIDPEHESVTFDLNSDGVLNEADRDLDLPGAAKVTDSIGLIYDLSIGSWRGAPLRHVWIMLFEMSLPTLITILSSLTNKIF